jgi:hypothetical protein
MKKTLALLLIVGVAQGSLDWEHEVIKKDKKYYALTNKYKHFSDNDRGIRRNCEFAPKGWVGKYKVETACDFLYHLQLNIIDEYIKEAVQNNQNVRFSEVEKSDKFIKEDDRRELIKIILNKSNTSDALGILRDDYINYFNMVLEDELSAKKLSELSGKYSK